MYSSSDVLVQGRFRTTSTVFIMFGFSDIESGLLFIPILDVSLFKVYKINKNL